MASSRAEEVAEVLWELKRAEKLGKFSIIAKRAGFSAGSTGRAMHTTMRTVRRDWPHLQWWRAVQDDGLLEQGCEQVEMLREAGFELQPTDNGIVAVAEFEEHLMNWDEAGQDVVADQDEEAKDEAE